MDSIDQVRRDNVDQVRNDNIDQMKSHNIDMDIMNDTYIDEIDQVGMDGSKIKELKNIANGENNTQKDLPIMNSEKEECHNTLQSLTVKQIGI